jgi:SAM-dependent methyltransferase
MTPDEWLLYHRIRFTYHPKRAVVWLRICRYLQPYVFAEEPLLELGAGYGDFLRFIQAKEKWALDWHEALAAYWGPEVRPLLQSALEPIPLPAASLGTVLASNFFEHFTIGESEAILKEVARVLRPGGRLIAIQPDFGLEPGRYFDDYTHKTVFTGPGFCDFLQALGWRIVRLEPRFLPFSMKSRLPKAGWLVALYLALPWRPLAGQFLAVAEAPGRTV